VKSGTGCVKGLLLVNLHDYVVDRHGDAAWEAVVARLKTADPEVWSGIVLTSSWYPIRAWNRAFEAAVKMGDDTSAEMRKLGHFVAERDIHKVFRMLLRIAPPEFVLGRTGSLWGRYFDVGTLRPVKVDARRWDITLEAPVSEEIGPGSLTCLGIPAWIDGALALTGTEGARIVHARCRFAGAPRCLFEVTW
jgi:hypothetical protein